MSRNIVIDLETTTTHDTIWMAGVYNVEDDVYTECSTLAELSPLIRESDSVIMHNGIDFDEPVLKMVWDYVFPDGVKVVDTYVMSRLWCPRLDGGHSLKEWGRRLGNDKGDFTDYDEPAEGETWAEWKQRMSVYCKQDVMLTCQLHEHLMMQMRKWQVTRTAFDLEHATQYIVSEQVRNGIHFDIDKAQVLYSKLLKRQSEILDEMQQEFLPIVTERWSDKTGKRLKDGVEMFNPASRNQIAKRLMARGVQFTELTSKGNIAVSEEILESLTHPAAASIQEYMMVGKRISQLNQWFEYYNPETQRIYGRVDSMGTGTYRMSQFKPNLAQVPANDKPYGEECRELFCVPEGKVMLGCDASGLELRCFANRTGDPEYIKVVTEGDAHQYHADLLNIARRVAKTFIYAFIYGAGNGKLGTIVDGNGAAARALFLDRLTGLAELKETTENEAAKGYVIGLDGRRVRTKEIYSALNYKLQSDGALVMKQASVNLHTTIPAYDWKEKPLQVVAAHDEWQFEVCPEDAEQLGRLAVAAIEQAGRDFNMLCPLTGEYDIGHSWKETH